MRRAAHPVAVCLIAVFGLGNAPAVRAALWLLASPQPCTGLEILHPGAPASVAAAAPPRRVVEHEVQRRSGEGLPSSSAVPTVVASSSCDVAIAIVALLDPLARESIRGRAPPA